LLSSVSVPSSRRGSGGLSAVGFEAESKLSHIENGTFRRCRSPVSICVPSSAQRLSDGRFHLSEKLSTVTFAAGFRLPCIVFLHPLRSFARSASRAVDAFRSWDSNPGPGLGCSRLSVLPFERDSKLSWIEREAFWRCPQLSSVSNPTAVQTIGRYCLLECRNLSNVFPSFRVLKHLYSVLLVAFICFCSCCSSNLERELF
jgi:hypothetical protein